MKIFVECRDKGPGLGFKINIFTSGIKRQIRSKYRPPYPFKKKAIVLHTRPAASF